MDEPFTTTISRRSSSSQSNNPAPPLMDSTMYLLSEVEMWGRVSPTEPAMSLNCGIAGKPGLTGFAAGSFLADGGMGTVTLCAISVTGGRKNAATQRADRTN